ncbi:hypothetical protein [Kibdelosporangium phytohabitans]|nr:hypothetical protein [Kibdelosporangium phytohabitans]MBE1470558.1 transcriptional regulator with XRE-family HTH domain [Kibdelosporangium phytohabitans]
MAYERTCARGQRDNPTLKHLTALATFFGVPPAYFLDEKVRDEVEGALALINALKDAGIRDVALRAAGLPAESLGTIGLGDFVLSGLRYAATCAGARRLEYGRLLG